MRIFEDYIEELPTGEVGNDAPVVEDENWEYCVSVEKPGSKAFEKPETCDKYIRMLDNAASAFPEITLHKAGLYSTHNISKQEFHRANPNFDDFCLLFNGHFKSPKRALLFIETIACIFAKIKKYNIIFFAGTFYHGQKFDLCQNDFMKVYHYKQPLEIAEKSRIRAYIRTCGIVSLLCQKDDLTREAVANSFGYIKKINDLCVQFWLMSSP